MGKVLPRPLVVGFNEAEVHMLEHVEVNAAAQESGNSNEVNATPPNAVSTAVKEIILWDKVKVIRNMGVAMADPTVPEGMFRLDPVVVTPFGNGPYKTLNGNNAITIGYYVNTQAPGAAWVQAGYAVATGIRSGALGIQPDRLPKMRERALDVVRRLLVYLVQAPLDFSIRRRHLPSD